MAPQSMQGADQRRPCRIPLAVHDRGIARADQVVADGHHGHAGPTVADGVHAALRREQADQGEASPRPGRRQQGPGPRARSPRGTTFAPRLDRPEDFDEPRAEPILGSGRLSSVRSTASAPTGIGSPAVTRTATPGADHELATPLTLATADQAGPGTVGSVGGAKGIAVEGGAVERGLVDVADGRLGQDQPQRLGQRDLDRLARLGSPRISASASANDLILPGPLLHRCRVQPLG